MKNLIKGSTKRLIKCGNVHFLYEYQKPYYYNFSTPNLKRLSGVICHERRIDSLYRARKHIRHIIYANAVSGTKFVTFTFKECLCDIRVANSYFRIFVRSFNYELGYKMKYICIPEYQKRGAVHYHCLFFNMPYVEKTRLESIWGHGFVKPIRIDKVRSLASYVCKYLTKDTLLNTKNVSGVKLYFTSRDLIRPVEYRDINRIDNILNSDNFKVVFSRSFFSERLGTTYYKELHLI